MIPQVSVLMAVHNGAATLPATLASIAAQTLSRFEFVIVDDASDDATPGLLAAAAQRDSRLQLIRNGRNLGLTASLNIGLAACTTPYVARIDADDLAAPQRLAVQAAFLDANADHVLVGARESVIGATGEALRMGRGALDWVAFRYLSHFAPAITHSSAMFRREGTKYDEQHRTAQDFALWLALQQRGKAARLDAALVTIREHPGAISQTQGRAQQASAIAISSAALAGRCPAIEPAALAALAGFVISGKGEDIALLTRTAWAAEAAYVAATPVTLEQRRVIRALTVNQLLKGASRAGLLLPTASQLVLHRPVETAAELLAIARRRVGPAASGGRAAA